MEHPENTSNEIRDFLNGRLDDDQAAAFRQRMAQDPALEDQVAFARLMMGGLDVLARRKRQQHRVWVAGLSLGALALLLTLYYFFAADIIPPTPEPQTNHQTAKQVEFPPGKEAIKQGGGQSPKLGSDRAVAIAWNPQGEVILAGQFLDTTRLGQFTLPGYDNFDIFLAACSPQSGFRWARQFGSAAGNDYITKIALDSKGNILMTGGLFDGARFGNGPVRANGQANGGEGDFFIAKLGPAGRLQWLDHAGGDMIPNKQTGNNLGMAIATDRQDNVIATGMYLGTPKWGSYTLPAGGPNEDLYLVKYDAAGKLSWVKTVTCDYQIVPRSVDTDVRGNIYLTGMFGHHNLGGTACFDGDTLHSYGGRDIFIAKFTPKGKLLWVRQAGSSNRNSQDSGNDLAVDASGNAVLTGFFEGTARFDTDSVHSHGKRDIFTAKYDPDGRLLWVKSLGGSRNDQGSALCLDPSGNIYCTGLFSGTVQFDSLRTSVGEDDIYVLKYDPAGRLLWVRQTGGDAAQWNPDGACDIAINESGQLVFSGFFSGVMHIGRQTLVSAGREDIFVLFFDRHGNFLEAKRMIYML